MIESLRNRSALFVMAKVTSDTSEYLVGELLCQYFVYLHLISPTQGGSQHSLCFTDFKFPGFVKSCQNQVLGDKMGERFSAPCAKEFHENHADSRVLCRMLGVYSDTPQSNRLRFSSGVVGTVRSLEYFGQLCLVYRRVNTILYNEDRKILALNSFKAVRSSSVNLVVSAFWGSSSCAGSPAGSTAATDGASGTTGGVTCDSTGSLMLLVVIAGV